MRKLFCVLVILLNVCRVNIALAQNTNPNYGIFFQAVARDNFSNPAKDRVVFVESSILQFTSNGTKVLTELHQTTTDGLGVFSINIGSGQRIGGTLSGLDKVDWANGPYFLGLKIAIKPLSPVSNWDYTKELIDLGASSFGTVPYAYYAGSSAGVKDVVKTTDTAAMLLPYAKSQTLTTLGLNKLNVADSISKYVTPTQLASKTFDSTSIYNQLALKANSASVTTSLASKLNIADSINKYVTPTQLAAKTFDSTAIYNQLALKANSASVTTSLESKLNIADSINKYVTPTQLAAKTFDSTAIYNQLALKANSASVNTSLNTKESLINKTLDVVLDGASDIKYPSVKAVKSYVDASIVANTTPLTFTAPLSKSGFTVSIPQANASVNGYLNSSDWNLFNNKIDGSQKAAINGVATLGNDGKIPSNQIPSISFQSASVVSSQAAMLSISGALVGSIAIRTDNNKNYVLSNTPSTTLSNWIELATPNSVTSVNGFAGPNVVLTTNDVYEGSTNKYYTDARVRGAISATAPMVFNNTTGAFSITQASITTDGFLSATDWNIFNNKQNALTAGTDYVTPSQITLASLGAEAVANKSNNILADGTSTTKYPSVKMIKDYVDQQSANAGVADNSISSAKINGTIAITKGGTGATSAADARNNLGLVIGTDVMAANATTTLTGDVAGTGNGSFATTVNSVGGVSSNTISTFDTRIASNTSSITNNTANILLKAPIASPAFTGTPIAPTPATSDNSTKIATTEYVKNSITAANAGISSIGNISGTSNAKGATISGTAELILTPADATNGGVLTNGAQTIAGAKTFNANVTAPNFVGDLTGNATTATTASNITATLNTTLTSLPNLNTVGTITSGIWNGTTIAVAKGGTGAINAADARTNLGLTIGTDVMAANATTTLTGDVTGAGSGTFTTTLSNSGVTAGSYGSTTAIPTFNVDAKGRITNAGTVGITAGVSSLNYTTATSYADGGTISGTSLTLAAADGTNPGLISTGAQTIAGAKTFTNSIIIPGASFNNGTAIWEMGGAANSTGLQLIQGGCCARLRIDDNGRFAIGANYSPTTYQFDVQGDARFTQNVTAPNFLGNATSATTATTAGNITATSNTTLTSLSNLNTVGTITSGTWSGTTIAVAKGGTGATTASVARTNLGLTIGTDVMAANATTTLTGDITGSGSGTFSTTLSNIGVTAGSYGSSTAIPTLTVDSKGRITSAGTVGIIAGVNTLNYTSTSTYATGGTISGTSLTLAAADGTNPGLISTGAQMIAGAKTFSNDVTAPNFIGNLTGAVTGNLSGTATTASNLAGGVSGSIPYQTAAGITAMIPVGAANQFLTSVAGGTYTWTSATAVTGNNVPYTGASGAVDLGAYDINAKNAKFTGDIYTTPPSPPSASYAYDNTNYENNNGLVIHTYNQSGFPSLVSFVATGKKSGNFSSSINFLTRPSGTTAVPVERLRITRDGFVGIGTTAPTTTLDVVGGGKISGDLAIGGTIASGTWSGTVIGSNFGGAGSVNGLLKADGSGVVSAAVAGTDYQAPLTAGTSFIAPNAAITAATKTKITYDAFGLVTAGADATTADIASSTDKRYVTDAQSGVLSNTSGTNTGDETASTIKTKLGLTTLSGSNTGDQTITLTGDVTGTGTGTFTSTLAASGVSSGTYGSSTEIPVLTVDSKGRVTTASTVGITAGVNSLNYTSTTSYAAGGTISGTTLTLAAANGTNPGLISTGTQTIAGAKTFSNTATFNTDVSINSLNIGSGGGSNFYNTALGYQVLRNNVVNSTNGTHNTGVGYQALTNNTSGFSNVAIGGLALQNNTNGKWNTAVGYNSIGQNASGNYNTALGLSTLFNLTSGTNNTAIGNSAGRSYGSSSLDLTTASESIFIGSNARAGTNTSTNEIVIGYNAIGNGSNTITLGNTSTTANFFKGDINLTGNIIGGTWSGTAIANDKLVNSTTTLGSTTLTLGGTANSVTGLTSLSANNLSGTLSGTATSLATGRTIDLTGDVTYTSPAFDGSVNVTGVATLAASGVTSGTYGSSTTIPVLTVDTKGRITTASTVSIVAGVNTMTAISATSNANGATISGTALTLTPASSTNGGVVSTAAQTFAGVKTFSSSITATSSLARGTIFSPTLTAAANNDVLAGIDINPTFVNGSFTGVNNYGLRVQGIGIGTGKGNVSTNTAVGNAALGSNTTGSDNTAFGYSAMLNNGSGSYNTAIGSNSQGGASGIYTNTSNTSLGANSLNAIAGGSNNIAIGVSAMYALTTGTFNIAIGEQAGSNIESPSGTNTTGNRGLYIGYRASPSANSLTNEIVIGGSPTSGYNTGLGSHSTVLGNSYTQQTKIYGVLSNAPATAGTSIAGLSSTIAAQNAGLGNDNPGGAVNITAGNAQGAGNGGDIVLTTGTSTNATRKGKVKISGDIAVNTDKFTVAATSGNTSVAGTLGVTEATTLTGATTISNTTASTSTTTGALIVRGGVGVAGKVTIGGTLEIDGGTPGLGKVLTSDAGGVSSWTYGGGTTSTKTGAYTILLSDKYVFFGTAATAAATFTLPAATGNDGKEIIIKNKSTFSLTIQTTGSETIFQENSTGNSAASSITLGIESSNNWVKLVSDGTQWVAFRGLF